MLKSKDPVIFSSISVVPTLQMWLAGKEKSPVKAFGMRQRGEGRREAWKPGNEM